MSWPGVRSVVLIALASSACQQPAAEAARLRCGPDPAVSANIEEVLLGHVAAHLDRDPVAAAADYTEDVWFKLDGGVELRSRDSMVELYRQMYETTRLVDFTHTSDEVTVCGDAAHAVGHYTEITETDGEESRTRFTYMLLWRQQTDGSWKISRGALITAPSTG